MDLTGTLAAGLGAPWEGRGYANQNWKVLGGRAQAGRAERLVRAPPTPIPWSL